MLMHVHVSCTYTSLVAKFFEEDRTEELVATCNVMVYLVLVSNLFFKNSVCLKCS